MTWKNCWECTIQKYLSIHDDDMPHRAISSPNSHSNSLLPYHSLLNFVVPCRASRQISMKTPFPCIHALWARATYAISPHSLPFQAMALNSTTCLPQCHSMLCHLTPYYAGSQPHNTRCQAMPCHITPYYASPSYSMLCQARPDSKPVCIHPYHANLGLAIPCHDLSCHAKLFHKSHWKLIFHASLQYQFIHAIPRNTRSRFRLKVAFRCMTYSGVYSLAWLGVV